jgi:hypothetical protein
MKTIIILAIVLFAAITWADPRIEINDNFCHFILNPNNTDREIFVGGCDGRIFTNGNGVARGFIKIVQLLATQEANVMLGAENEYIFTNDDSDTPCTLVDSNGTEYVSDNWKSVIVYNPKTERLVYKLICRQAQQQ